MGKMRGQIGGGQKNEANLNGTVFEDHASGEENLLVRTGNAEVPASALISDCIGDMAVLGGHGHHGELLNCVRISLRGGDVRVDMTAVVLLKMRREEICLGVGGEVEGGGGGMNVTRPARIGEGGCVNIHGLGNDTRRGRRGCAGKG